MAELWLNKARRFRDYAREDLANNRFDSAAFFAQQSIELLIKGGLLIKFGGSRPITHSTSELLQYLLKILGKEAPQEVTRCAELLEQHYVQARYPDARINDYRKWELRKPLSVWTWCGIMYSRWLEALNEVTRWRETRFMELLNELCRKSLVVVLFGSRARGGDNTPLSDWDLMAVIPTGEYKVEVRDVGQVIWLPLSRLDEVLESSMVILDAVTDGKVLCGDSRVFDDVRDRVRRYIEGKGLVRTKSGWFPKDMVK